MTGTKLSIAVNLSNSRFACDDFAQDLKQPYFIAMA
jgi:hypothetical protein